MAKMKVMTPRQTLRIILLPLVPPLLLGSDRLLELRGMAAPDGSMPTKPQLLTLLLPPAMLGQQVLLLRMDGSQQTTLRGGRKAERRTLVLLCR
jgi:hypothetical protein